jgi:beta-glucosidase/6-phospho-beta-glucosidase/beta-galactosidase
MQGQIGLANNCDWREPLTDSPEVRAAAQESLEFFFAWLTDPVIFGEYPAIMRERLGDRLPTFTPEQKDLLKGSVDFIGLNHYTTHYASAEPAKEGSIAPGEGNGGMTSRYLSPPMRIGRRPAWAGTWSPGDSGTLERTPKASFRAYQKIIQDDFYRQPEDRLPPFQLVAISLDTSRSGETTPKSSRRSAEFIPRSI